MLGFEVDKTGEEVDVEEEEEDEPFLSANSESESEEPETKQEVIADDSVWKRLFGDHHHMTISDVLQSTPEAQKLKKLNFNLNDDRWGGTSLKGNNKQKNKKNKDKNKKPEETEKEQEDSPPAPLNDNDNDSTNNNSVNNDKNTTKKKSTFSATTTPITASSKAPINLESSKLSLLDSSAPVEPTFKFGKRKLKKVRKEEREKTKGPGWFNLPAAEMTEERKNDLDALQLRAALDTKHFYKRNNLSNRPKYFQVGRILDNPLDFYRSRIPKKQRKRTIAEELVAEAESKGLMVQNSSSSSKRKKKKN